jgi:hypothetical protein
VPKISDNAALQLAITPACLDREALIDAYGGTGEWADEARADIIRFQALRGKSLGRMSPAALDAARCCFIFAAQWESSLADATGAADREVTAESIRQANLFNEVRKRRWGNTTFENQLANAVYTPVTSIK